MNSTTSTTTSTAPMLAAISVVCFALGPVLARIAPPADAWLIRSIFWGLGIALVVVALRQHFKGRRGER